MESKRLSKREASRQGRAGEAYPPRQTHLAPTIQIGERMVTRTGVHRRAPACTCVRFVSGFVGVVEFEHPQCKGNVHALVARSLG